jgi:hypothetical protein
MPNVIVCYLRNAMLFLPAIGFILYWRIVPGDGDAPWYHAALIGALLALPHSVWLLRQRPLHGTGMGLNLYLVICAVLPLVSSEASLYWGKDLGSAAMILCVLTIHVLGLAFAPEQFSGKPDQVLSLEFCKKMVVYSVIALAISIPYRHNPFYGGVLPIVALALLRKRLKLRVLARTA